MSNKELLNEARTMMDLYTKGELKEKAQLRQFRNMLFVISDDVEAELDSQLKNNP